VPTTPFFCLGDGAQCPRPSESLDEAKNLDKAARELRVFALKAISPPTRTPALVEPQSDSRDKYQTSARKLDLIAT